MILDVSHAVLYFDEALNYGLQQVRLTPQTSKGQIVLILDERVLMCPIKCPNAPYILVACGLDYSEAGSILGVTFGECNEAMSVDVQLQPWKI